MKLTKYDLHLLDCLDSPVWSGRGTQNGWFTPLDLGGHSRSPISRRLTRMHKMGLVEAVQRFTGEGLYAIQHDGTKRRGSRQYRITEAGKAILCEMGRPSYSEAMAEKPKFREKAVG